VVSRLASLVNRPRCLTARLLAQEHSAYQAYRSIMQFEIRVKQPNLLQLSRMISIASSAFYKLACKQRTHFGNIGRLPDRSRETQSWVRCPRLCRRRGCSLRGGPGSGARCPAPHGRARVRVAGGDLDVPQGDAIIEHGRDERVARVRVRPDDLDARDVSELVQAAGSCVPVHAGAPRWSGIARLGL